MPPRNVELRIEYLPLDEIRPALRNPKLHDLDEIDRSFAAHAYFNAVILDERTGRLVGGHGRHEALRRRRDQGGREPPDGIKLRDADSAWLVPVQRGWASRSDHEAEQVLLADNRIGEIGGHDQKALARLLSDLAQNTAEGGLHGTGYTTDDLAALLKELGEKAPGRERADDLPETPPPVTHLGDLWILGSHRLLCGDAGDPATVGRLMGQERAALMATDPPYGVAYQGSDAAAGSVRPLGKGKGGPGWDDVANDDRTGADIQPFLEGVFRAATAGALRPNAAWYLWHAQLTQGFFAAAAAAAAADLLIHRQIVWAKPRLLFGRGDYHWRHELCFYGWVKGHRPPFLGNRNQTTVWEIDHETSAPDRLHPTQKPVACFDIPIRNHTEPGEIVYEPFSGSGSQIIAAELAERRCFALDLDPRCVDLAVARWEKATNRKAERRPA